MINCEFCKSPIGHLQEAHGIMYGAIRGYPQDFMPAKDAAWTVICKPCGEMLYKLIYSKLKTSYNPTYTNVRRSHR